jgi:hypothetical protein
MVQVGDWKRWGTAPPPAGFVEAKGKVYAFAKDARDRVTYSPKPLRLS